MKLNDAQKQAVAKWIEQGLNVAEVQNGSRPTSACA